MEGQKKNPSNSPLKRLQFNEKIKVSMLLGGVELYRISFLETRPSNDLFCHESISFHAVVSTSSYLLRQQLSAAISSDDLQQPWHATTEKRFHVRENRAD